MDDSSIQTRLRTRSRASTILSLFQSDKSKEKPVILQRKYGLGGAVALLMGTMIGTGIFISPTQVLNNSGSVGASLCIWAACGVIAFIAAVVFAELGLMLPKSGGDHTYLEAVYGNLLAFLHGYGAIFILRPMSLAISSIVFGQYMVIPFLTFCEETPQHMVKLLAGVFVITIVFIQWIGLKTVSKLQVVVATIQVLTLVLISVLGFVQISRGSTTYLNPSVSFADSSTNPSSYGLAFFSGMFSYEGWNTLCYAVEEMKEPYKTFPRGVFIAVPATALLYVLVNIAYFTVLSPSYILLSHHGAVALSFAENTMGAFYVIIPFLVAISAVGSANGIAYTLSRMTLVLSREGQLPEPISMVTVSRGSPIVALIGMAIFALIYISLPTELETLIEVFSFAVWLSYSLISLGFLILRIKRPDSPRPFRAHWSLAVVLLIISTYFVIASFFTVYILMNVVAMVMILSGLIFYFPFVYFKWRAPFSDDMIIFFQLFFEIVKTEYQTPEEHEEQVQKARLTT